MKKKDENLKNEPLLYADHKKPTTRREFLSSGLIGLSTSLLIPNITTLLSGHNSAFAQTIGCTVPEFTGGLPYLCFEGAGGMNIAGSNVLVGFKRGGSYQEDFAPLGSTDKDFIRLGLAPTMHPSKPGMISDSYGLKFHSQSGILAGLNDALASEMVNDANGNSRPIQDMIDGLIFCVRTADDSAANPLNTIHMASKAGANGKLVQLIGDSNTDTGSRSTAPGDQIDTGKRPSRIRSFNDSSNLLSIGNKLMGNDFLASAANGGNERIKKFMNKVSSMSMTKMESFKDLNAVDQIRHALDCSYQEATGLFQKFSSQALNPMNDPAKALEITNAFGTEDLQVASIANLVLDQIAGAGSITIGGCDYHNGTALTGYNKDRQIGRSIGKCIKLAAAKGKDLFIHLYTDGGVTGDSGGVEDPMLPGKVIWSSDSGTRSAAMVLIYKHGHTGGSLVKEDSNGAQRQVGNFIRGGGVDLNANVVSNSTENLWKAIMLNYLAAQGKPLENADDPDRNEFVKIYGRGSLPPNFESLIRLKDIS